MKKHICLLVFNLLLIILGCFLPLYKLDNVYYRCGLFTTIALVFNTLIALYLVRIDYKKFVIIPQVISLIYFIIIWVDFLDKFSIMKSMSIKYNYCIGFYLLLIGITISVVQGIIFVCNKDIEDYKVKYVTNKKTGYTERRIVK